MIQRRCGPLALGSVVVAILAAVAVWAGAETPVGTEVELRWSADGERVEAVVRADLDGLLVGLAGVGSLEARLQGFEALRAEGREAVSAAVDRLEELLRRRIRLRADGRRLSCSVRFPERIDADGELVSLGPSAVVSAAVPRGAGSVSFFASRAFREIALVSRLGATPERQSLVPGEQSRALSLAGRPGS